MHERKGNLRCCSGKAAVAPLTDAVRRGGEGNVWSSIGTGQPDVHAIQVTSILDTVSVDGGVELVLYQLKISPIGPVSDTCQ